MSYDTCRKCGVLADKPYHMITKECSDVECPQKARSEFVKAILASVPVKPRPTFAQATRERESLEDALNRIETIRRLEP